MSLSQKGLMRNTETFTWYLLILLCQIWHSEDRASGYILIMKANKMHYFSILFDKVLYMFWTGPMSIIWSSNLTMLAGANRTSMTNTYCVYTVLRYSWWTVDLSKTCRVLHQINMRNSASRWLSLYEYITMHGPVIVKNWMRLLRSPNQNIHIFIHNSESVTTASIP